MKRILPILLTLTLVLCGCEKDNSVSKLDTSTPSQTQTENIGANNSTSNETTTDEVSSIVETSSGSTDIPIPSTNNSKPTETSKEVSTSKPTETSKRTEVSEPPLNAQNTSKPAESSKPIESKPSHSHSYTDATCTDPPKCSCGATNGNALGHKWVDATCTNAKTCTVCKKTEGAIGTHVIEHEMCKYCKQVVVVSPQNLDITKSYIFCFEIDDHEAQGDYYTNSIEVHTIDFSKRILGQDGIYSSNLYQYSDKNKEINYNNEIYYYLYGGKGVAITYEINKKEIILRHKGEPTQYALLNLLSNNKLKVVSVTDGFCGNFSSKVGWSYEISK